jgi:hypothetical protein
VAFVGGGIGTMHVVAAALVMAVLVVAAPPAEASEGSARGAVDLDVLFIGAHPDDEAFGRRRTAPGGRSSGRGSGSSR